MTERIWDKFLTEEDKAVFAASGYGAPGGFGKRPAILVIDVSYNFCGDRPEPGIDQAVAQLLRRPRLAGCRRDPQTD